MSGRPFRPAILSLVSAGLLLGGGTASAQPCLAPACTTSNTVQVRVGTVLRLSVQGPSAVLAIATLETIQGGSQAGAGPTAVVRSNGSWRLDISAAQEAWTPLDSAARPDKPAADLTWSTQPTDAFSSLSTAPADVARGGPTGGTTLPLYYRTRFTPASDTPGSYSIAVRLTLVGA
jgi:hypothetical protein